MCSRQSHHCGCLLCRRHFSTIASLFGTNTMSTVAVAGEEHSKAAPRRGGSGGGGSEGGTWRLTRRSMPAAITVHIAARAIALRLEATPCLPAPSIIPREHCSFCPAATRKAGHTNAEGPNLGCVVQSGGHSACYPATIMISGGRAVLPAASRHNTVGGFGSAGWCAGGWLGVPNCSQDALKAQKSATHHLGPRWAAAAYQRQLVAALIAAAAAAAA